MVKKEKRLFLSKLTESMIRAEETDLRLRHTAEADPEEARILLGTGERGLTQDQAKEKLRQEGRNTLPQAKKRGAMGRLAAAFVNPFTVGIAQTIAQLPMYSGWEYRVVVWFIFTSVVAAFFTWYGEKIRKHPSKSMTAILACRNIATAIPTGRNTQGICWSSHAAKLIQGMLPTEMPAP